MTAKKKKNWASAETGLNINMNGRHKKEEGWFVLSEAAKTIGLLKKQEGQNPKLGRWYQEAEPIIILTISYGRIKEKRKKRRTDKRECVSERRGKSRKATREYSSLMSETAEDAMYSQI